MRAILFNPLNFKTMKKILCACVVALMALAFVSCNSEESIRRKAISFAEESVEATLDGDYKKLAEIEEKVSKYRDTLTEEENDIFDEAAQKALVKLFIQNR